MPISFVRAAIVLGLVSAMGPVAIDMYLPALPAISADLGVSSSATQLSLLTYFAAVALFQPVFGPLSDMFGRRLPLTVGLVMFVAAAIGSAFAPNIETLVALRFLQGIGGCACMVIPRAVVRDLYTGIMAARLMALLLLVFGVGPMLAPLVGSVIGEVFGWRAIFGAVALAGAAGIVLLVTALPETRPAEKRLAANFRVALASYAELLRDPRFLGLGAVNGCGLAGFFTFVAASPFVYIEHFGLSPMAYSLAFSFNAAGFFAVAQLNARIGARIGLGRMVRYAATYYALMSLAVTAYLLAGGDSVVALIGGLFLTFSSLGLVLPSATVLALEDYGPAAGTASSMIGTIQFAIGALAIVVVSLGTRGNPLAMVATVAAFGLVGFVVVTLTLRDREPQPAE